MASELRMAMCKPARADPARGDSHRLSTSAPSPTACCAFACQTFSLPAAIQLRGDGGPSIRTSQCLRIGKAAECKEALWSASSTLASAGRPHRLSRTPTARLLRSIGSVIAESLARPSSTTQMPRCKSKYQRSDDRRIVSENDEVHGQQLIDPSPAQRQGLGWYSNPRKCFISAGPLMLHGQKLPIDDDCHHHACPCPPRRRPSVSLSRLNNADCWCIQPCNQHGSPTFTHRTR